MAVCKLYFCSLKFTPTLFNISQPFKSFFMRCKDPRWPPTNRTGLSGGRHVNACKVRNIFLLRIEISEWYCKQRWILTVHGCTSDFCFRNFVPESIETQSQAQTPTSAKAFTTATQAKTVRTCKKRKFSFFLRLPQVMFTLVSNALASVSTLAFASLV